VTTLSGVWTVPAGEDRLWVEVRKGIRVDGRGVESMPCEAQEVRRKMKKVASRGRGMRRL